MKISLLHATRRPEAAQKCQQLWLGRSDNSANIEIITCVDHDDEAGKAAFPDAVISNENTVVAAWNKAAEEATGDVLVALDDDWQPAHAWDQIIESYMSNGADILHVGDKHRKDELICHPIVSKRFYEAMGYLWHPSFKSVYCDNWFTEVAKRWGYVDATKGGKVDLGFLHANPSQGYGEEDDVARKSNSKERYEHGATTLGRLQSQTILAFTCADRPQYLKPTLDSWLKTNLSLLSSVHFFIEPTDRRHECVAVIDEFAAKSPVPVIKHFNKEKLGVLRNPWHLFDHCFRIEGAIFTILGEDDFLVSPDILDFLWGTSRWNLHGDEKTMAICAKWVGDKANKNPATWHRVTEFTGNIWGTWPHVWNKYLKDTWDFDYSSGKEDESPAGWDWNIQLRVMPKNDLHCIVPTASRSKHIGIEGIHCTEEVFEDTVAWNFVEQKYDGNYLSVEDAVKPIKVNIDLPSVVVSSSGDLGDCVVSLAPLVYRGNPTIYHLWDDGMTKGIVAREKFIRPFLESQPIIKAVRIGRPNECDWRSEDFRHRSLHDGFSNLAEVHARHAKMFGFLADIPRFDRPWLTLFDVKPHGRIVVNRSPRYHNDKFPWAKIVKHYGKRLVFVGLDEEYEAFSHFGEIERVRVKDMLELAHLIAGSSLFIGNQSVSMTIAEGLKHPRIQEACLWLPDCIYPGVNAQYIGTGAMTLPSIDGSGEACIKAEIVMPEGLETPPGGWQYHGLPKNLMHPNAAISMIRQQKPELSNAEAKQLLMEFNAERVPEFFDKSHLDSSYAKFRLAMLNAGHPTT
jgi:hypothetical protein